MLGLRWVKLEGETIHAISLSSGHRPVIKNVSEMSLAPMA